MMSGTDAASPEQQQPRLARATVVASLPNAMFRLRREDGSELLGHVTGAMRMQFTRLLAGDLVEVEVSPFDRTKARISARVTSATRPQPTTSESEFQS